MGRAVRWGLMVLLLCSLGGASAQAVSEGWKILGKEQGVVISTRQRSGEEHPTFRGQATIKGAVLHVLSVVLDTPRSPRWVRGADGIEIVKQVDERTQFVHMYTELPWPIRDRDMIMKRTVQVVKPGTEFVVRYQCAPSMVKEKRGYLRVSTCDSHFTIKAADANKTFIDYQVQLDPGGGLPSWGRRWMERRITVDTIARLERQVGRTHGQYQPSITRWQSLQQ